MACRLHVSEMLAMAKSKPAVCGQSIILDAASSECRAAEMVRNGLTKLMRKDVPNVNELSSRPKSTSHRLEFESSTFFVLEL